MTKATTPEQISIRLKDCKGADEAAELLPRLTVIQLRRLAKERKVILPRTVRRKADIITKLLHELFPPSCQIETKSKNWPEIIIEPRVIKLRMLRPLANARNRLSLISRFLLGFRQPRYRRSVAWARPP
ncbi:MAG: hypothetical protein IJU98_08195 [Synergistaceae bacterium]|nr:hypothetical protein [Synergistaceae bacterium]